MLLCGSCDQDLTRRLTAELAEVECRFAAELLSDLPCINSLVAHSERYRGKMLRPMLVLASGLACGAPGQELREAHRVVATVVEMVHMATLVHDDILDEALVRRRGATINRLSGNETAVMLGDYLISHAYHLCSSLGDADIARQIADATNTVCAGELLQLANRNNPDLDEATYYEIIRRKTASLCGACCRLGAVLHGAPPQVAESLYAYGEQLGVAFQIVDDLLDLVGEEQTVGKTLGRDLQKGKLTLPLIHYLRTAPPAARRWLRECVQRCAALSQQGADPAGAEDLAMAAQVRQAILAGGSVQYADAQARRLVAEAKKALDRLPPQPARDLLRTLSDSVVTRQF
jgi:octaprenyl-diphosphate synthase